MSLTVLMDFDNIDRALIGSGPIAMARAIALSIPASVTRNYETITARLYGGWRSNGLLTNAAQRLIPNIRSDSPSSLAVAGAEDRTSVRLNVELAERPLGSTRMLTETFVKDRGLRNFRSRTHPWNRCECQSDCGMKSFAGLNHKGNCPKLDCSVSLGDVLVRDEQKMVDTMMVADLAYISLVERAKNVVVVSSDTDMWPGVMLALRAGCYVLQIHTKAGWRTQTHLINTLDALTARFYEQTSI